MRIIDADKLKHDVLDWQNCYNGFSDTYDKSMIIGEIDAQPTIQAEPVRHGRWTIKAINKFDLSDGATGYEPVYQCSECGGVEESYLRAYEPIMPKDADFPRYCPHCGCKMDLGEVNDD